MGGEAAIIVFIFVAVGFAWTWLWRQRVTEKPWLQEGLVDDHPSEIDHTQPPARTALYVFLAVVASVFSLFFSAYFLRMEYFDWRPLQEPGLLWVNTVMLVLGSVSIQMAANAAKKSNIDMVGLGLIGTGIFTVAFIGGQLWAWQMLVAEGAYLYSNPANAFFYLITGLHALHIVGGLYVWARTTRRVWAGHPIHEIHLSVDLCKVYWHFLLMVWVVMFGLMLST